MARTWIWAATIALLLVAPLAQAGVALKGKAAGGVRMTVREVRYDRGSYVVLLQNVAGDRLLPIWIGDREAQAIQLRLSNGKTPRPMTHDLMETILSQLRVKIARVEVDDLRNNVFHGKLTLKNNGKQHRIDGRPSDLITLAVGANLPIYVAPHVLKKAGISAKPKGGAGGSANPQEI